MRPSGDRLSHPSRRRILQTTAGLTALGVLGNSASMPVAADPGTEQWAFDTAGGSRSSPTVVDGTVYVGSNDNNLYAVAAATGEEQWVFETGDVVGSPTVADDTVFVGSWDNNLYAVDTETGEEQWAFKTGEAVSSSPTVADGTVFVGCDDTNLYAVDAATGEQEWAFETGSVVFSSPTVVDGTVYVGSADDNLYALDAGVAGSSEDSRVHLGTLGHHGEWRYADQSIPVAAESARSESVPGFGVGSGITALGATGYMLKRRLENN